MVGRNAEAVRIEQLGKLESSHPPTSLAVNKQHGVWTASEEGHLQQHVERYSPWTQSTKEGERGGQKHRAADASPSPDLFAPLKLDNWAWNTGTMNGKMRCHLRRRC